MSQLQGIQKFQQRQLALPRSKKPLPPAIPLLTHDRYEYDPATCTLKKKEGECTNQLHLVNDALELIRSIDKPVAVLSICGPYRSGKSYFLSRMLGGTEVFKLGHTQNACTQGIWMATTALECDEFVLLLLDTEGTDSAAATESTPTDVLVMSTLLSSLLIYNSQGMPLESDLEDMSCFAQLSSRIFIGSEGKRDTASRRKHFPDCLWLLRDFGKKIRDDKGNQISATEYLKTQILVHTEKKTMATKSDHAVRAILQLFPSLESRAIISPSTDPDVLESITECKDELTPRFNREIDQTRQYILQSIKPKRGFTGALVNGPTLASLAQQYNQSINTPGAVPNLEMSWMAVVKLHLTELASKLVNEYEAEMEHATKGKLPLEENDPEQSTDKKPLHSLVGIHERIIAPKRKTLEDEIAHYMLSDNAINELQSQFTPDFERQIERVLSKFRSQNQECSHTHCEELFAQLYQSIQEKINKPGLSYSLAEFSKDLEELKRKYMARSIGPAKDEVYQKQIQGVEKLREPLKEVSEVTVVEEQGSLKVCWRDNNNQLQHLTRYEVQYDCENGRNARVPPSETSCILRKPDVRVHGGQTFSIRVRAVNKFGTGSWSAATDLEIPPRKPEQPSKPAIQLSSPSEATISVLSLKEEEQNGSSVTALIVEIYSDTAVEPQEFNIAAHKVAIERTIVLPNVVNDTAFHFHVKMRNALGDSDPSDAVIIPATNFIPGPLDLQVTGRAHNRIKIRWNDPILNQAAVLGYKIEICKPSDGLHWVEINCDSQTHKSKVFRNLEAGTGYWFRICAVNHCGKAGPCKTIKTFTKYSKRTQSALTVVAATANLAGAGPPAEVTVKMYYGKESKQSSYIHQGLHVLTAEELKSDSDIDSD